MIARLEDRSLRNLLLPVDIVTCAAIYAGTLALLDAGGSEGWQVAALGFVAAVAPPLCVWALSAPSTRSESVWVLTQQLLTASAVGAATVGAAGFALRAGIAPWILFSCLAAQTTALGAIRLGALVGLRWLRRNGRNRRDVLVIGTGPRAVEFTETVARHPEWGLRVVGYVDEGDTPCHESIPADRVFKITDFPSLLRERVIDEVIVACPRSMLAGLGPVLGSCSAAGVPLTLMNDLFGDYLPPPRAKRFGARGALSFAPVHHDKLQRAGKRAIDVSAAAVGLLVWAPLLVASAVAMRLSSPGPVFTRQLRGGLNGRPFVQWKLRTMDCDGEVPRFERRHGSEPRRVPRARPRQRFSPVGRFLWKYRIDEMPMLWNVLRGEMSLVGPRPPTPAEVAAYKTWQRRRLSVRPGLTCLAQVRCPQPVDIDDWIRLDLEYIDTWSLGGDLRLVLQTLVAVVTRARR